MRAPGSHATGCSHGPARRRRRSRPALVLPGGSRSLASAAPIRAPRLSSGVPLVSELRETTLDGARRRDEVTVERLRAGDPEGLKRLLADHGGLIRSLLRKDFGKVLDDSELDEAMAAMLVKVWKSAPRFDATKGRLPAWAYVIARNSALRLLAGRRKSAVHPVADLDDVAPANSGPAAPDAERERLIADVHRCIDQLPLLQREILRADLEVSGSAPAMPLARQLGTSTNSIYVSRVKGRKKLFEALQALGHTLTYDPGDGSPMLLPRPSPLAAAARRAKGGPPPTESNAEQG